MCGGNGGSCHDRYVLSRKEAVWDTRLNGELSQTLTLPRGLCTSFWMDAAFLLLHLPAERRWLKRLCQPVPSAQILSAMIYHDGNKNLMRFIYYRQSASKPCVILLEFISDLLVCTLCEALIGLVIWLHDQQVDMVVARLQRFTWAEC